jgi:putative transposase
VIHSDHGTQFTSWAFTESSHVRAGAIDGPIGDCNDNALIEALWSRMQIELLDTHRRLVSDSFSRGRRASNSAPTTDS